MVDDNAINPLTGETIYVGILEKLPEGFRWIHDLHTDDWLKIVRGLTVTCSIAPPVTQTVMPTSCSA